MADGQIHIIKAQSDSGNISLIYTLLSAVYRPKRIPQNITQRSSSFLISIAFEFVRFIHQWWVIVFTLLRNDLTCNGCNFVCDANPTLIHILLRVIFLWPIR